MAAAKKPASAVSNEFTLGTPWAPDPALKMPDPNVPGSPAMTERGEILTGPRRANGLGYSDYA